MKVSKFGGSSVANAGQIEKVRRIVEEDPNRKYVVVSAPGKDEQDRIKVTDSLFNIATEGAHLREKGVSARESYDFVIGKFTRITNELGVEGRDLVKRLEADLHRPIQGKKRRDFFASRGEHYHARIIARYFRKRGLSAVLRLPEDIGLVVSDRFGNARVLPESYENIARLAKQDGILIIPGYYGITRDGDIAVFSRGGSDLTGGELAYALHASLYENWTDRDGIFQVNPDLIPEAKVIPELTFKEIRLLASKGFNVFHYDAMINCRDSGIPINIRNTNNTSAPGTMIVSERVPHEAVVGIARMDDVAYVYVEKDMIDEQVGFMDDILRIFREYELSTHYYPADKDDIAYIVEEGDLNGKGEKIIETIRERLNPRTVIIKDGLSILNPVGIGMRNRPGVLAAAAVALADRDINLEIVDQSPAQIGFHFGVKSERADEGYRALYNTFFGGI